jgi:hypothetical protein
MLGRCAGLAQEVESVSVKIRRAASFEQSLGRFQHYSSFSPISAMVVGGKQGCYLSRRDSHMRAEFVPCRYVTARSSLSCALNFIG